MKSEFPVAIEAVRTQSHASDSTSGGTAASAFMLAGRRLFYVSDQFVRSIHSHPKRGGGLMVREEAEKIVEAVRQLRRERKTDGEILHELKAQGFDLKHAWSALFSAGCWM